MVDTVVDVTVEIIDASSSALSLFSVAKIKPEPLKAPATIVLAA